MTIKSEKPKNSKQQYINQNNNIEEEIKTTPYKTEIGDLLLVIYCAKYRLLLHNRELTLHYFSQRIVIFTLSVGILQRSEGCYY